MRDGYMNADRQTFQRAEAALVAAGWVHVADVTRDETTSDVNFGSKFRRGDEIFWLNINTVFGPLPTQRVGQLPATAGRRSSPGIFEI
jgi:hypothetical protein